MTKASERKERGLIFTGKSPLLIRQDKKWVTRRLVTLIDFKQTDTPGYDWCFRDKKTSCWNDVRTARLLEAYCPWKVGDRFYIKETWAEIEAADPLNIKYRADTTKLQETRGDYDAQKWRSSMFMPRRAARVYAEILEVRLERVGDITSEDAIAEGCYLDSEFSDSRRGDMYVVPSRLGGQWCANPRAAYQEWWEDLHAGWKPKKVNGSTHYFSYPWSADSAPSIPKNGDPRHYHVLPNPHVWVFKFQKLPHPAQLLLPEPGL